MQMNSEKSIECGSAKGQSKFIHPQIKRKERKKIHPGD